MRYLTVSFLVIMIAMACHSEDYNPPTWRSGPGTSYQIWRFNFQDADPTSGNCSDFIINETPWGQRSTPDKIHNPYQEIAGICAEYQTPWMISGQMDWLREHNLRNGVWMLKGHKRLPVFMNFMIPNADEMEQKHAEIYVQIVYEQSDKTPELTLRYPSADTAEAFIELQAKETEAVSPLPLGWHLLVARFELPLCPLYQILQLKPPSGREVIYIDEVTIDTICRNS